MTDYYGVADLNRSEALQARRSVSITIDLDAVRHNLSMARKLAGNARQFATIKADAYGHGAVPIAHALSKSGTRRARPDESAPIEAKGFADGFAVVTLNEGLELRESGINDPILILQGPQSEAAAHEMLHQNLWPVIHDWAQYGWFSKLSYKKDLAAWLKVDTGMGRLGMSVTQANDILRADDGINWMGLMTHFASADETGNDFTLEQYSRFNSVAIKPGMSKSLANSAAVLNWPQTHEDWVRPGIMLYGCNPLDKPLPGGIELRQAMTVEAPLISVKSLEAGAGVGYAQTWHCPENMRVGYVALGYRDGLPRVLDETASVSIQGRRCPIIGRVSMDSIAVDLRPAVEASVGSMAQFWGPLTPIDALAKAADTISYELLTSIRGQRNYTGG